MFQMFTEVERAGDIMNCDIWERILLNFNVQTWKKGVGGKESKRVCILCRLFDFVRTHQSQSVRTLYIISNYIYLSYGLCSSALTCSACVFPF